MTDPGRGPKLASVGDQGRLPKGSTISAETWKVSWRMELSSWIQGHKLKRTQGETMMSKLTSEARYS